MKSPKEIAEELVRANCSMMFNVLSPNGKGHGGNIGLQLQESIAKALEEAKLEGAKGCAEAVKAKCKGFYRCPTHSKNEEYKTCEH